MTAPFFTVAIPTKNRPHLVGNAIASVLEQSFDDLELIVCDNSDEAEAVATAATVGRFSDPRIRYVRSSGRLSMPDNWDAAIRDARGEYLTILTDRSALHRRALNVVSSEVERTGARLVSWTADRYVGEGEGEFRPRPCTLKRYEFDSRFVLQYFLHGHPKYAPKIIPRLMHTAAHRTVLQALRQSPVGRCCPPVCPDYTSGFLMLAHAGSVLILDEALFVSCGAGTGFSFRQRGDLAERFRQDLVLAWTEFVDRMPSRACFSHALILNDLFRLRDALTEFREDIVIDKVQYYLGCLLDYSKALRHGTNLWQDHARLMSSLKNEDIVTRRKVLRRKFLAGSSGGGALQGLGRLVRRQGGDAAAPPRFGHVFEALAWADANRPRPIGESFLDKLPTVHDLPDDGFLRMAVAGGKQALYRASALFNKTKVPVGKRVPS